jgi:hypothetical protein
LGQRRQCDCLRAASHVAPTRARRTHESSDPAAGADALAAWGAQVITSFRSRSTDQTTRPSQPHSAARPAPPRGGFGLAGLYAMEMIVGGGDGCCSG